MKCTKILKITHAHSYFLLLLFGSVLVAVVVVFCLVSLACNRQSSETAVTFLEGVINMEV